MSSKQHQLAILSNPLDKWVLIVCVYVNNIYSNIQQTKRPIYTLTCKTVCKSPTLIQFWCSVYKSKPCMHHANSIGRHIFCRIHNCYTFTSV